MSQVVVRDLVKTYRIAERAPGVWGAVRGLWGRRHREVQALARVSFSLERGELLGFIGPNGAGKSTTIKILSGILQPTSGSVEVGGRSPFANRRRHVETIGTLVLAFDPSHASTPELIARAGREQAVLDVHVERPAIEEVIARFYDLHGAVDA